MNDAVRMAIPIVGAWEGRIAWLYRDTRGHITIGMGRMLPSLMDAFALPLRAVAPDEMATKTEIEADWNRLMEMPFGGDYGANFYRCPTSVFLTTSAIDQMACEDLTRCDEELKRDYSEYEHMPLFGQIAMLDMDYNLGETKLRRSYPLFDAAADMPDYLKMASECHRDGISSARNDWTRKSFAKCLAGRIMAAPTSTK